MRGEPGDGTPKVFLRPKWWRSPMKPLEAVLLKASE